MTEQVLITIIIVAGVLCVVAMIGAMIEWHLWRQKTGRNALENAKREIIAKEAWADANERLAGRRQ